MKVTGSYTEDEPRKGPTEEMGVVLLKEATDITSERIGIICIRRNGILLLETVQQRHSFIEKVKQVTEEPVIFHPILPNIRCIIFNSLNILRSSQRCKAAFPSPPLYHITDAATYMTYESGPNTADHPSRHRELSVVTKIGAKHVFLLRRETHFTPSCLQNEKRPIGHHITCSSSNLIHKIQCSRCKMQYIGKTKHHISDRFG